MYKYYKLTRIYIIIFLAFLTFQLSSTAWAKIYYVDKSHFRTSNSNPGTEDLPWLTIQHAVNTVTAGDTVYVKEGIYAEMVISIRVSSNFANV